MTNGSRIKWWPEAVLMLGAATNPKWTRIAKPGTSAKYYVAKKKGIGAVRQRSRDGGKWELVCGLENSDHDLFVLDARMETQYFSPRQFWISILGVYESNEPPKTVGFGEEGICSDRMKYTENGKTRVAWVWD